MTTTTAPVEFDPFSATFFFAEVGSAQTTTLAAVLTATPADGRAD